MATSNPGPSSPKSPKMSRDKAKAGEREIVSSNEGLLNTSKTSGKTVNTGASVQTWPKAKRVSNGSANQKSPSLTDGLSTPKTFRKASNGGAVTNALPKSQPSSNGGPDSPQMQSKSVFLTDGMNYPKAQKRAENGGGAPAQASRTQPTTNGSPQQKTEELPPVPRKNASRGTDSSNNGLDSPKRTYNYNDSNGVTMKSQQKVAVSPNPRRRLDMSPLRAPPRPTLDSENPHTPQKCEMCEQRRILRYRCIECNINMCNECKMHHSKMKISHDHELINFSENKKNIQSQDDNGQVVLSKELCKKHKTETLKFFCQTCRMAICINCKVTEHEGHRTTDLAEEVRKQRGDIPMRLVELKETLIPVLVRQLQEADHYEKELAYNAEGTAQTIANRSKFIQNEIQKASNSLVNKLRNKESRETQRINERRRGLNAFVRSAHETLAKGDRIIEEGDDFEILGLYLDLQEISRNFGELSRKRPRLKFSFNAGDINSQGVVSLLGRYAEKLPTLKFKKAKQITHPLTALELVPELDARLIKQFKCIHAPGNKVTAIAPVSNTTAWMSFGWTTTDIHLFNKDGYKKDRLELDFQVDDMARANDGTVYISEFMGSGIRLMDREKNVRLFTTAPLKTRGLALNNSRELLVCIVDICSLVPPPRKAALLRYNAKGTRLGTLEGEKRKRIPTHPYRVTENIDGSIVVCDWVTDQDGRVIIIGPDGRIRSVYYGNAPDVNSFLPYSLVHDRYGHILIGDVNNREIHLLDIKGQFLRILLGSKQLSGRPYAMAIDSAGELWVGNELCECSIYRYLQPSYTPW